MGCLDKIISWESLPEWREGFRRRGRRLAVTNGCFDLLHLGHAVYLEQARATGDGLLVGINSDASVRSLKGPSRPLVPEADRAGLVAALAAVDAVCLFEEPSANAFLDRSQPDIYIKGGDYTLETLNPTERATVEKHGSQIRFIPFLPGRSTSSLIERIRGIDLES